MVSYLAARRLPRDLARKLDPPVQEYAVPTSLSESALELNPYRLVLKLKIKSRRNTEEFFPRWKRKKQSPDIQAKFLVPLVTLRRAAKAKEPGGAFKEGPQPPRRRPLSLCRSLESRSQKTPKNPLP